MAAPLAHWHGHPIEHEVPICGLSPRIEAEHLPAATGIRLEKARTIHCSPNGMDQLVQLVLPTTGCPLSATAGLA